MGFSARTISSANVSFVTANIILTLFYSPG
jgi:hypothetical protein